MILQGYDFYELNKNHHCVLQIGGSDQWGNIVNGVDLTRRMNAEKLPRPESLRSSTLPQGEGNNTDSVFGLTTPLLTTSDGKKMGKTADGAVWLDGEMLAPFDYFQYFRNVDDADVSKLLKFFTHLTAEKISEIEKEEINKQKEILAFETTQMCHGEAAAIASFEQAKNMFSGFVDISLLPEKSVKFSDEEIKNGKKLIDILRETELCESGGEAKRLIKGGGVKVDDIKVDDENLLIKFDSTQPFFKVALVKKKIFKINIVV